LWPFIIETGEHDETDMKLTRRKLLSASASTAAAAFLGVDRSYALVDEVTKAIEAFTDGVEPVEGLLNFKIPKIAENGGSVPITVSVDSSLMPGDYVDSLMIMAPANPNPLVLTFRFSELSGEARAVTRMRLAETQEVTAFAKLSSGRVYKVTHNVEVTIGGCH